MFSGALIGYILTAALRDRLLTVLFLGALIAAALGIFLGSAAITESDRFALVFAAAGLRLVGLAVPILFIAFYIQRAFEHQDIDFLLSRPVSRTAFICSHAIAFSFLSAVVGIMVTATVFGAGLRPAGLGLWGGSLIAEYIIMANAALFFSMVLRGATAGTMATFAFYVLARLIGEILGIINSGAILPGYHIFSMPMQICSLIVPRLDLMAQSTWLIYGTAEEKVSAGYVIVQGAVFSVLLVSATLIDLRRRQF